MTTPQQAKIAANAFRRFGTDRHTAGQTIGDCVAHGLAWKVGLPLLFRCAQFWQTEVPAAVAPE